VALVHGLGGEHESLGRRLRGAESRLDVGELGRDFAKGADHAAGALGIGGGRSSGEAHCGGSGGEGAVGLDGSGSTGKLNLETDWGSGQRKKDAINERCRPSL